MAYIHPGFQGLICSSHKLTPSVPPLFPEGCHPSSARTGTTALLPHGRRTATARPCGPTGSRPSHQPTPPRGAGGPPLRSEFRRAPRRSAGRGAGQQAAKDNEGGGGGGSSDPPSGGAAPTHLARQQRCARLLPAGDPAKHALAVVAAARGQKLFAPRAAGGGSDRGLLGRHRPSPRQAPPRYRPRAHPPSRARGVRQWRLCSARGARPRPRPRQAGRAAASERSAFSRSLTGGGLRLVPGSRGSL